ncbi:MAG: M20/M25/M40 family metallo-hydrolase [Akkermansiaceae bacterium]|nr:M20/M25/M40 family metallo-hydrolase [Akkermansiaceae bacterium]
MSSPSPTKIREELSAYRETLLANALMLGEIPAPAGDESARVRFLADRFNALSLQGVSIDEAGNVQAMLPGRKGDQTILLAAHADTHITLRPGERLTINVTPEHLEGQGLADNTVGLACLLSIPELLERLDIKLDANIIFLGHVNSLGSRDFAGLRFFLDHVPNPVHAGLVLEGISLGRLNPSCLGMVQADIKCRVHQSPGTRWEASENAIVIMHRVIRRILEIPVPQEPRTSVILGSLNAGKTFNRPPEAARLRLEVRSEEPGKAREIRMQIQEIVREISSTTASEIDISYPALRKPGGIPFSHPMVTAAREVMAELDVETLIGPSYSDLSVLISHNIPAVTLGLTTAEALNEPEERVEIEPYLTGIAQAVGVLQRIDKEVATYPEAEDPPIS